MKKRFAIGVGVSVVSIAWFLTSFVGCEDVVDERICLSIPEGGCPLSRGVACEDPSCLEVYACRPNQRWELDHTCAPRDAAARVDGATKDAREPDAAAPSGGSASGCAPLQEPDCDEATATACPSGCCGCEDLFACVSGVWIERGPCTPGHLAH